MLLESCLVCFFFDQQTLNSNKNATLEKTVLRKGLVCLGWRQTKAVI